MLDRYKWLDTMLMPLVYLLNRPLFDKFNKLIFMLAYRINGMGIAWSGQQGLSMNEEKFMKRHALQFKEGIIFDIGANAGHYAKAMRAFCPDARIISFEPQPRTFQRLRENCEGHNIEVEQLGFSAEAGVAQMYELAGQSSSTVASLAADTLKVYGQPGEAFDITLETIDGYCDRKGIEKINLLKVDTEGLDLEVLRGAKEMLAAGRIDVIEFEFIVSNLYTNAHFYHFVEVLEGYQLYRLCLNGSLVSLLPYDWRFTELYMTYNVIAVRNGFELGSR